MTKSYLKIFIILFVIPILFLNSCTERKTSTDNNSTASQFSNNTDSNKTAKSELSRTDKNDRTKNSIHSNDSFNPPSILEVISISKIVWSIILIIIGFYVIRLLSRLIDIFAEKSIQHRLFLKGLIPVIRIFGWLIIFYFLVAGIFKPPVATLIAVTASVGIAVGFGAQDLLKNIIGGILILFDRPYQVGDKIQLDNYYGEVIKIGLRSTKISTPDDSTVTIPNGEVMSKSVSNTNYGEPNCQVVAEIFLPIDVNTNIIREIAIETAQVSPYVYLNKPITVLFSNEIKMTKSFLKMSIKAYVLDLRYEFIFKSDMIERVLNELLTKNIISKEDIN